jgi:multimeric flavodoxin WrbA
MKLRFINGSPKPINSSSGLILQELLNALVEKRDVKEYSLGTDKFIPMIFDEICDGDAIVFAFPLYVDSIPSNALKMLIGLEESLKARKTKNIYAYAIINNGFYEGEQTRTAFEIMGNFCERAGLIFGGGIGMGAGETFRVVRGKPIGEKMFKDFGREIKLLAEKIEAKEIFGIKYLSPSIPRFLWRFMAKRFFWNSLARANKLSKKDILRKLS